MTALAVESPPVERPLTLTEFATALGRSYPYVFKLWKEGKLDGAYRIGRMVVIPPETVAKMLAETQGASQGGQ